MSIVDQLKTKFQKKPNESEQGLSLAMPEVGDPYGLSPSKASSTTSAFHPASTLGGVEMGQSKLLGDEMSSDLDLDPDLITLPFLGRRRIGLHQRILGTSLATVVIILAAVVAVAFYNADQAARHLAATGVAMMQSQRLAKSASQALVGSAQAFPDVKESAEVFAKSIRGLKSGSEAPKMGPVDEAFQPLVSKVVPLMENAEKNASVIGAQRTVLTRVGEALRAINRQSADLLEIAETVSSLKLQQGAPASELSAAGQLVMLTQRIGKSANEFVTVEGVSPEAVFLLGKDLNAFNEISQGLLSGSADLRLSAARDPQLRERLTALTKLYEQTRAQAGAILGNLQGLVAARESQASILGESELLRRDMQTLQDQLGTEAAIGVIAWVFIALLITLAALSAFGLASIQVLSGQNRQRVADRQRQIAQSQEQEAKRVNDANQAAILRLMNELQTVAEGDLTQEATVTEDITGAIADSVNYTVEELRQLVGSVQTTATKVAQTTAEVESTSTELLAASTEQLREIRETGQSVLDMAGRINQVSGQAQESAQVARQSLIAAESGLAAVQNAIGGMNAIRDQIQETSKRIKRLGESSQEIGEITELISDITEQTNVLALNAAIQAASAGEAGRGFSVVAEEVQRLAERSADATRQISALVRAIQTDTQDAVGAMERSTQGVVEGAKLSDNAGTALTQIDHVSRRLADLIEQISMSASREAASANVVAENIQHIFAVTEKTGEGTRATAQQVRELSRMAEELRQSVARFKIA